MKKIINNKDLEPTYAIVNYENDKENIFLKHEIKRKLDGGYSFGNGRTLTQKMFRMMMSKIKNNDDNDIISENKLFPENLLFANKKMVIWYSEYDKQELIFAKNTEINSGTAEVPGILFVYNYTGGLKVYSFLDYGRPDMNTPLYICPFLNCDVGGNVCFGSGIKEVNTTSINSIVDCYNKGFWQSEFTEFREGTMKVKQQEKWKAVMNLTDNFLRTDLVPLKFTLKNIING